MSVCENEKNHLCIFLSLTLFVPDDIVFTCFAIRNVQFQKSCSYAKCNNKCGKMSKLLLLVLKTSYVDSTCNESDRFQSYNWLLSYYSQEKSFNGNRT